MGEPLESHSLRQAFKVTIVKPVREITQQNIPNPLQKKRALCLLLSSHSGQMQVTSTLPHLPPALHRCYNTACRNLEDTQCVELWCRGQAPSPPNAQQHGAETGLHSRARTACHVFVLLLDYSVGKRSPYAASASEGHLHPSLWNGI